MTNLEAYDIIQFQYPELTSIGATFGLMDMDPNCTVKYVLDYYFDHAYSEEVVRAIQNIEEILKKYHDNIPDINVLAEEVAAFYYIYHGFESGTEFLQYVKKYLSERLQQRLTTEQSGDSH